MDLFQIKRNINGRELANINKKLWIPIVICILLATISFGTTYAILVYINNHEEPTLSWEVGEVKVALIDKQVENTGNLEARVRVRAGYGINEEFWRPIGDEYYEYFEVLRPGEKTEPLFADITGSDVLIYVEAIDVGSNWE